MKFQRYYLCLACFFLFLTNVCAIPTGPLPDATFNKKIRTVEFYKEGWEFSYPILELTDEKPLLLTFDVLQEETSNLSYTVVFCDANWMPSRLPYIDYLNGFPQNSIYQYQSSVSTNIPYQHYRLNLPNENMSFKLPGNYALVIYEGSNEDEPVLIKRFVIVDPKVQIEANAHRAILPEFQNNYQEIDFTIFHNEFSIDNPHQSVQVVVLKNNQWNNSITDLKPLFIRNGELEYNYEDKNLFFGGNEYRGFDTKSLKYRNLNIEKIDFVGQRYEVDLKQDKSRKRMPYLSQDDLNGKYLVQNQEGTDPAIDAEYIWVKFSLHAMEEIPDGNVFVVGGFTDNNLYDDNRMVYNADKEQYELTLPIKQGYYNYQYVLKDSKGSSDDTEFEGSYYETENDYVIYVYYRPFGQRYDALIGTKIVNTLKYK